VKKAAAAWCVSVAVLAAALLLRAFAPAVAPSVPPADTQAAATQAYRIPVNTSLNADVTAKAALIYDNTSGRMLYEKNGQAALYPASVTKLLTALTALDITGLDTVFTVGDENKLVAADASVAGLKPGYRLTVAMLLDAMMICSGNDAAYTLAAGCGQMLLDAGTDGAAGGTGQASAADGVQAFVARMNDKAASLGMTHSHFMNPDGYQDPDHYLTAEDLLLLTKAALQAPPICAAAAKTTEDVTLTSGQTLHWHTSDQMLLPSSPYYYPGLFGLKTGSTDQAGDCFVAAATRDGRELIAIVLDATSPNARWQDSIKLLNYGFIQ